MPLLIKALAAPLRIDEDDVVRVGATRVTMDTVVGAFRNGASAEEIAERYNSLALADIYAVISYYLSNKTDVDAYLDECARHASEVRRSNEARVPQTAIRERLFQRRPS